MGTFSKGQALGHGLHKEIRSVFHDSHEEWRSLRARRRARCKHITGLLAVIGVFDFDLCVDGATFREKVRMTLREAAKKNQSYASKFVAGKLDKVWRWNLTDIKAFRSVLYTLYDYEETDPDKMRAKLRQLGVEVREYKEVTHER